MKRRKAKRLLELEGKVELSFTLEELLERRRTGSAARLEKDPRFLRRVARARVGIRAGKGTRLEEVYAYYVASNHRAL